MGTKPILSCPLLDVPRGLTPRRPNDFEVHEIGMRLARDLNRKWHSLLPRTDLGNLLCGNQSLAMALHFDCQWWAVGIVSYPIIASMCDGHTLELRRLALCDGVPKNTATWFLKRIRLQVPRLYPHIRKLISYQAVDVHHGTIYRADNWKPVGEVVDARPQRLPGSKQRATGPLQTTSRKLRWEIDL